MTDGPAATRMRLMKDLRTWRVGFDIPEEYGGLGLTTSTCVKPLPSKWAAPRPAG